MSDRTLDSKSDAARSAIDLKNIHLSKNTAIIIVVSIIVALGSAGAASVISQLFNNTNSDVSRNPSLPTLPTDLSIDGIVNNLVDGRITSEQIQNLINLAKPEIRGYLNDLIYTRNISSDMEVQFSIVSLSILLNDLRTDENLHLQGIKDLTIQLAGIYAQLGAFDRAMGTLEQTRPLMPNDSEIKYLQYIMSIRLDQQLYSSDHYRDEFEWSLFIRGYGKDTPQGRDMIKNLEDRFSQLI